MFQRTELPIVNFNDFINGDKNKFIKDFDKAWKEIGFVSITGYPNNVDNLKFRLYNALRTFSDLPDDVKMKYYRHSIGGQRGYIHNGIEQSGGKEFTEFREHIMVGPRIQENHPLREYQKHGIYLDNEPIKEVPQLIPLAESLLEILETMDLIIFEAVAIALNLPVGYFSSRLAYGDSSLRLHIYPKVNGEILNEKKINGVSALEVKFHDDKIVRNLVRAGRHKDIDTAAALLGAENPGLEIETRDGIPIAYTAKEGHIVYNTGDYAEYETGGIYPSSPHWVGLNNQTAKNRRLSIVRFLHPRSRSTIQLIPQLRENADLCKKFPPMYEGVLLAHRLHKIGYFNDRNRDALIERINNDLMPDEELVERILAWEKTNNIRKLSKYYF